MRCPYCQRPVKPFDARHRGLAKKLVPYCGACRRYVPAPAHKLMLAALALAACLALLTLLRVL